MSFEVRCGLSAMTMLVLAAATHIFTSQIVSSHQWQHHRWSKRLRAQGDE